MQKRSHKLLAAALLRSCGGFSAKRYEWAFLIGSVQPDCNPFTYLKGSLKGRFLRGHDFSNSRFYIHRHADLLQQRSLWSVKHYYTFGKLTHYLADTFTYSHTAQFHGNSISHHCYESHLRNVLFHRLRFTPLPEQPAPANFLQALDELHQAYSALPSHPERDAAYILQAAALLFTLYTNSVLSFQ